MYEADKSLDYGNGYVVTLLGTRYRKAKERLPNYDSVVKCIIQEIVTFGQSVFGKLDIDTALDIYICIYIYIYLYIFIYIYIGRSVDDYVNEYQHSHEIS